MNDHEPFLKIRFDGIAVGPGRIPVPHLLRFLANLNKALQRTGRVLLGEAESVRPGRQPDSIKSELELDLVLLTHGSPSAVLGFERRQEQTSLPGMDFGQEILEKALTGLDYVQKNDDTLPPGFDAGVLMAWRDVGILFHQGIEQISISLNHRKKEGHSPRFCRATGNSGDAIPIPTNRSSPLLPNPEAQRLILPPPLNRCRLEGIAPGGGRERPVGLPGPCPLGPFSRATSECSGQCRQPFSSIALPPRLGCAILYTKETHPWRPQPSRSGFPRTSRKN